MIMFLAVHVRVLQPNQKTENNPEEQNGAIE